jgi:DNA-binding phage protein
VSTKRLSSRARAGLYKALGKDGNPSFGAVLKVIHAMGLEFHIAPRK